VICPEAAGGDSSWTGFRREKGRSPEAALFHRDVALIRVQEMRVIVHPPFGRYLLWAFVGLEGIGLCSEWGRVEADGAQGKTRQHT
jgi:hypothetical protein